jgi:putative ABC transport system substrate-binding protein
MRRREFITLLGGTATAWPIIAGGKKSRTRLGFLSAGSAGSRTTAAQIVDIHRGLKDNGMIEGRDYVLETRFAAGHYDRFPALANELAQAGVSVVSCEHDISSAGGASSHPADFDCHALDQ